MAWKFFTKDGAEKRVPASVVNPQATIYHNATQALTTAVQTVLALNTVLADTASMTGVANKITITKAGRYTVTGHAEIAASATGLRQLLILLNGVNAPGAVQVAAAPIGNTELTVTWTGDLLAGDVIGLQAQQTSGGSLNVTAGSATNLYGCSLSATKVDGAVISYVGVPGSLIGQELAYAEITASVTSTQTVEASATPAITLPTYTFDGVTPVILEVYTPQMSNSTAGACANYAMLFDNGTSIGYIGTVNTITANQGSAFFGRKRFTPSAGAHIYSIRLLTAAGTFTFAAGAGGISVFGPANARIVRAA